MHYSNEWNFNCRWCVQTILTYQESSCDWMLIKSSQIISGPLVLLSKGHHLNIWFAWLIQTQCLTTQNSLYALWFNFGHF